MPGVGAEVPLVLLAKMVSLGIVFMPAVLVLLLLVGLVEKIFVAVLRVALWVEMVLVMAVWSSWWRCGWR
jgi:hypothetical protein